MLQWSLQYSSVYKQLSDTVHIQFFETRDALSQCVYSYIKEVQGNQKLLEYISYLSLLIIITNEINRTQRRKEKLYENKMQIS